VRGTLLASPVGDALTLSAGVACYPSHALGAAELVHQASRALEEARARGRDRVELAPEPN
jgi:GGDEF domain-containing protein